ncbi:MAG: TetR/AcrR family transcriptional regulator, partial [Hyphomonadaceae bacterium]
QAAYQRLLEAMVGLFERSIGGRRQARRQTALTLAALCVGGMILARTLPDSELAGEVREAAHRHGAGVLAD